MPLWMNPVRCISLQNTDKKGSTDTPWSNSMCTAKVTMHEVELIKKTCQCPHAYHTNTFTAYQPSQNSSLSSVKTIAQYQQRRPVWPKQQQVTNEQTKEDHKVARMLNVLTKARPSQNIRDLYKYRCGYGPSVIIQKRYALAKQCWWVSTSLPRI